MSLVDYDASSDEDVSEDEDNEEQVEEEETGRKPEAPKPRLAQSQPSPLPLPQIRESSYASDHQLETTAGSPAPPIEKLPDASLLLDAPAGLASPLSSGDHASRVAAARAESALRKRESHSLSSSVPRSKMPRGTLPHMKNVPDTVDGLLVPPQLSGRSNVVTEDISKLFVKGHAEKSSH
ncbi:uncharacterized protein LOC115742210 [Rhodamnia argentea]|uniref:Uncharacterized protein LOC115742210 n=1 Tax=Rhodamnia argentea TaxID=178133 RepID=A0A8B8PC74_9MYRT|nr:uncharacterized protein LOC115742210 [Rhodamnia argentea]XP_048135048.1 uncharacterized protein LOC115742210 [Rhodamnia argentea]XP_048135049.1 uncharacterized protein LOC115742210 [Rhodamnia argentea]